MVNYDNFAKTFSKSRLNMKWEEIDYFLKKYDLENKSVLDIGCGNGRLLQTIKEKNINIFSYLWLDLSNWLLDEAKKLHPESDFLELNMLDLDKLENEDFMYFLRKWKLSESQDLANAKSGRVFEFSKKILKSDNLKFDVIFFIASFHHLQTFEERLLVLEKAKKLLNKDSKIFFTNWNLIWQEKYKNSEITWTENDFWSIDFNIKIWEFDRFYHSFSIKELEQLFKQTWFEIIENRIFDNWKNIISIIKND